MKRKYLKIALWGTSSLLLAVVAAAGYAATKFTLSPVVVGDDYLLLSPVQAKECAEGGGCAIWSEREFMGAVSRMLERAARNKSS